MSWWELPQRIGRDFNVVQFPSEKSGETRHTSATGDFIFKPFGYPPCKGAFYLVKNNWELQIWSRIDRFLLSGMGRTFF
jgi:hypothetical protein